MTTVIANVVTLQITEVFATLKAVAASRWRITLLAAVIGFLLAWRLSNRADRRMSALFSRFWHERQAELRHVLKQARAYARTFR